MNPNIIKAVKHYLFGLAASSWNAGWAAVAGIAGIDAASAVGKMEGVHVLGLREMAAAFGGAFVLRMIIWINKNPIPETYESDPPFPAPKEP